MVLEVRIMIILWGEHQEDGKEGFSGASCFQFGVLDAGSAGMFICNIHYLYI